ncbi:GntR family transcriptional regulator [Pseudomonas sp. CCC3.2]|uniref:GntR family transcriptional regulator n=1 Tax=unclassified Pseudomonas TaxID=196821 RepID=UPI002AB3370B|nr:MULTISPECIES: GntR family transcriptional regulator [unclassified Pseudomonas]MDY7562440.1 GntR family transcriptional regulator [Pseudomonas sp. AB6]MEA9979908.1 GntR family transcriptional regulator [Pseudomonas sp. RTS4]MEB0180262.1 GntR family transcriptional regulator [Pseudomonas sp. CCC3.2]MEB0198545.1 GntR family transcriptional regulator [Pseudomonas sp. 5S4]MEB0212353.1 GntR family transcriptional regulator [Pseudomonas sp. AB6]
MQKPDNETYLSSILGHEQPPSHLARTVIEEKLRNAILDGRIPSGMALRQQELATLFGVSRMPVREALRQLEAQSLLRVEPHKGAVVAPLVGDDATQAYGLRRLLESEALRLSIPLLDKHDIAVASGFIEMLEVEIDYSQMGRLNRLFHMALYAKAPNTKLLRLIDEGLKEEERFLRFNLSAMGLGKLAQDDHWALLNAVSEKATDKAVNLLERHLNRGVDAINRYLKDNLPVSARTVGERKGNRI